MHKTCFVCKFCVILTNNPSCMQIFYSLPPPSPPPNIYIFYSLFLHCVLESRAVELIGVINTNGLQPRRSGTCQARIQLPCGEAAEKKGLQGSEINVS